MLPEKIKIKIQKRDLMILHNHLKLVGCFIAVKVIADYKFYYTFCSHLSTQLLKRYVNVYGYFDKSVTITLPTHDAITLSKVLFMSEAENPYDKTLFITINDVIHRAIA